MPSIHIDNNIGWSDLVYGEKHAIILESHSRQQLEDGSLVVKCTFFVPSEERMERDTKWEDSYEAY